MALRGTLTHRKTRRLAKALDIQLCFSLGIVESLLHVTAELAPCGDIGRLADKDIAEEMFYDGDPAELVGALVSAGFLDLHEEHRLVVHDWEEHADRVVKQKLARQHRKMVGNGTPASDSEDTLCHTVTSLPHNVSACALQPDPAPEPVPEGSQVVFESNPSVTPNECAIPPAEPEPETDPEPEEPPSDSQANLAHAGRLDELIAMWNRLPRGITSHRVQKPRGRAIVKGWRHVMREREVREVLLAPDVVGRIEARIRGSPFCHRAGWFRFEWLFATGKSREWNLFKLLDGAYLDKPNRRDRGPRSCAYDPANDGAEF